MAGARQKLAKPPAPRVAPVSRDSLHWIRQEESGQLLVWNWNATSEIWHATPYTVFYTPEKAFAAGYRYFAPCRPPARRLRAPAPGPQRELPIPFTLA